MERWRSSCLVTAFVRNWHCHTSQMLLSHIKQPLTFSQVATIPSFQSGKNRIIKMSDMLRPVPASYNEAQTAGNNVRTDFAKIYWRIFIVDHVVVHDLVVFPDDFVRKRRSSDPGDFGSWKRNCVSPSCNVIRGKRWRSGRRRLWLVVFAKKNNDWNRNLPMRVFHSLTTSRLSRLAPALLDGNPIFRLRLHHLEQGGGTSLLSRAAWIVHHRWKAAVKSINFILKFHLYLTMRKSDFFWLTL